MSADAPRTTEVRSVAAAATVTAFAVDETVNSCPETGSPSWAVTPATRTGPLSTTTWPTLRVPVGFMPTRSCQSLTAADSAGV